MTVFVKGVEFMEKLASKGTVYCIKIVKELMDHVQNGIELIS